LKALLTNSVPIFARRSMAACAFDDKLFFFGGVGASGTESILDISNDMWCFDINSLSWTRISEECSPYWPSPRRCVGIASAAEGIYLWGGSGLETDSTGRQTYTFLNDFWLYRPQSGRWEMLEPSDDYKDSPLILSENPRPEPRYLPIFHVNKEAFLIFSGYTEDRLGKRKMNDLWLRRNIASKWLRINNEDLQPGYNLSCSWPGTRYGSMSASDGQNIYICGGFSDEGDHIDVWRWSWDSEKWECLFADVDTEQAPSQRYCGACTLYGDDLWIFGGRSRRYPKRNFNDTWRFNVVKCSWEVLQPPSTTHCYDETASCIGYHAKSASAVIAGKWYLWGGEGLHGHVSDFWYFDFMSCEWQMIQPARSDDPKFW
jgi:hypothetical protein